MQLTASQFAMKHMANGLYSRQVVDILNMCGAECEKKLYYIYNL